MEGARSGRVLRNKRGRAPKAAGCGDLGEANQKGSEGWMDDCLAVGGGRLSKPAWIRSPDAKEEKIQIPT